MFRVARTSAVAADLSWWPGTLPETGVWRRLVSVVSLLLLLAGRLGGVEVRLAVMAGRLLLVWDSVVLSGVEVVDKTPLEFDWDGLWDCEICFCKGLA